MKKVALVTGATSGIGKANVELLLKEKIDVIAVARSKEKVNRLIDEMKDFNHETKLHIVMGDLSDRAGVEHVITGVKKVLHDYYQDRLDIMMNIAGIVSSGLHRNQDGNELTFATNHLSVFMLTCALVESLEKSDDPRILVVSSLSHYRASINFKNLQNFKGYNILKGYKRSKLYNVLFVKGFAMRYPHLPIFAIDPGLVKTEIGLKNTSKLAAAVWKWRVSTGTDAYYPASFMVKMVTDPTYITQSGQYFKEGLMKKSNPITYREDSINRLWVETEKILQQNHESRH